MLLVFAVLSIFISLSLAQDGITRTNGAPVDDNLNSETAGPSGPVLLQDAQLIDKLSSFDRERIPERAAHARGTAAKGYFTTTADLTAITRADIFNEVGKITPVLVRFSTATNSKGSPESIRDTRGFAVKFYTKQGNWDLAGNNFPVFFIRDSKQFPDMLHALKPDPVTNLLDPNRYFDFFSFKPEAIHHLTFLYSPLGIPANYRQMNGSSIHAFKFINNNCDVKYVKFTWSSKQGVVGLTRAQAAQIQSTDFNHATRDLYQSIQNGKFPKWDLYAQTIDAVHVNSFEFNPIDSTKIWPESIIKPFKIGELTLDEVPENFFRFTEQSAFSPNNLVPGIEPSEDPLLQGRLFSYPDSQRYRLGVNNHYLEPNKPLSKVVTPSVQDGAGYSPPRKGHVNYYPSHYTTDPGFSLESKNWSCPYRFQDIPFHSKYQTFKQTGELYESFSQSFKNELVNNLGLDLAQVSNKLIREKIASYIFKANPDYGKALASMANVNLRQIEMMAAQYKD